MIPVKPVIETDLLIVGGGIGGLMAGIAGSEGYAQPKDFIISGFLNTTIVTVITFGLCWLVGPMVL